MHWFLRAIVTRAKYWLFYGPGFCEWADAETISVLENDLKVAKAGADAALEEIVQRCFPKSAKTN